MPPAESVPFAEVEALAVRRAKLVRILGDVSESGSGDIDEIFWLWLGFEGSPPLRLAGRGNGEGFDLAHDEPPAEGSTSKDVDRVIGAIRSLASEPPAAAVIGSHLQSAGVVRYRFASTPPTGLRRLIR